MKHLVRALLLLALFADVAFAQANGKLQIHYMDVGQGDGAILISPLGETVLFDELTVAENIFLGHAPRTRLRIIDLKLMNSRAKALLIP